MKRIVRSFVPGKARYYVWQNGAKFYYYLLDARDRVQGKVDPSMPSRSQAFIYGFAGNDLRNHFNIAGQTFTVYFKELGHIQPNYSILEIGSGIGRMALALTKYLEAEGRYVGMDIVPDGIAWCQQHITPEHPNFQFQLINIYNKMYNPKGQGQAADYHFPFETATFDFVFLVSVFTHMLPAELGNYLSEIARLLKPGGRCLITYFLLNEDSRQLIEAGKNPIPMEYRTAEYWARNKHVPEEAIAFDEAQIRGLYAKYGLRIEDPIRYGIWSGRTGVSDWQDIVVAVKD
ncbi:MAG: class I SAM-dependent methyltransferase [Chloroflexi bacterium]|nr:class I SAM-dependent methyltransferase [Chloroflexota bacterium]